jgi:hypothetical protein
MGSTRIQQRRWNGRDIDGVQGGAWWVVGGVRQWEQKKNTIIILIYNSVDVDYGD